MVSGNISDGDNHIERHVLLKYHLQNGEASLAKVYTDRRSPAFLANNRYAALHVHQDGKQWVCVFDWLDGHDPVTQLSGCSRIVSDPSSGIIAALVPVTTSDSLLLSHQSDVNISLLRQGITGWSPVIVSVETGNAETVDVVGRADPLLTLTGELGQPVNGAIPVGLARNHSTGVRQFGVGMINASGIVDEWWDDHYDLHAALPSTDGLQWAIRASTRDHNPQEPLRHELWACGKDGPNPGHEVLDDGRFRWREPLVWPRDGLLAAHHSYGIRCLEIFGENGWVSLSDHASRISVTSAVMCGENLVTIESAVDSPPSVHLRSSPNSAPLEIEAVGAPPFKAVTRRRIHQVTMPTKHTTSSVMFLPPDEAPRGVVAFFHGGPTMSWSEWSWRWNPYPFTAAGHAVVLIDPAGSDGLGEDARAIAWRGWKSGIVPSALATLDQLRAEAGLEDLPLATMGGSFGGYLAVAVGAQANAVLVAAHATPFEPSAISLTSDAFWSWTREWGPLINGAAELQREDLNVNDLKLGTRLLLSHGMVDDQVPFHQSVKAARSYRIAGGRCDVVLLQNTGHAIQKANQITQWVDWALSAFEEEIADMQKD